jgi:hypothetical protein
MIDSSDRPCFETTRIMIIAHTPFDAFTIICLENHVLDQCILVDFDVCVLLLFTFSKLAW